MPAPKNLNVPYFLKTDTLVFSSIFWFKGNTTQKYRILDGQSACMHSCTLSSSQSEHTFLVYQVNLIFFRVWNLQKVQSMDLKKAGCKKQGHCYSKKPRPLLFLNNNDSVFSGRCFKPYFFQCHKPTHVFKTRIVGQIE